MDLTQRAKTLIWRILVNNTSCNMEHAQKIGHGNGCCKVCLGILETNEHIFFNFIKAQRGWVANAIYYKVAPQDSLFVDITLIMDIIDNSSQKTPTGIAKLFVIYHTT